MIRILVVDDHEIVRRGVVQLLKDVFRTAEFGQAANGSEALEMAFHQKWSLMILDVGLPGRGGLDVLRELRSLRNAPPVIVYSMYSEEQFALRAIRAGAAGYLTKETAPEELARAVQKVLRGGRYLSESLADRLAAALAEDHLGPPHETLSDREFTVLRMLASGGSVKQIAAELSLSVKTVSTYRTRILQKTGLQTTSALVRYAIERHLA